MKCAWNDLLAILPAWLRPIADTKGKDTLQELRLRIGQPVELRKTTGSEFLNRKAVKEDIAFVINAASRYSPWASESAASGYLTAAGGHRIGICGECAVHNGTIVGVRRPSSLCIRVARSYPGITAAIPSAGSVLVLGPPGSGKTTLLREIIRLRSCSGTNVAAVDERGELFPANGIFEAGPRTDIFTGCSKAEGIDMALRTMGPGCIAVDEITSTEDCQSLHAAGWCGVSLLATAHASGKQDFLARPVYRPLAESNLFDWLILMKPDKSWTAERMYHGL